MSIVYNGDICKIKISIAPQRLNIILDEYNFEGNSVGDFMIEQGIIRENTGFSWL